VLEGTGWEEHNIAMTFHSKAFLIDSEVVEESKAESGMPRESITSAKFRIDAIHKDDEDEFVSDTRTALPLLPSSDELVSIPLKALIVDFRICWIRLKRANGRSTIVEREVNRLEEPQPEKTILKKRLSCESKSSC
jgi:hypothetical protein